MFSLLRGVLLRRVVNRDNSRLIYIRQSANSHHAWFPFPEIEDLQSRIEDPDLFRRHRQLSMLVSCVPLQEPVKFEPPPPLAPPTTNCVKPSGVPA